MQVTKLRVSENNGLVPAGRYFAALTENLRATNARDTAALEKAEAQERRLEARYRKRVSDKGGQPSMAEYATHA